MSEPQREYSYRGKKENANAVKSTDGTGNVYNYKPGKTTREARKRIWDRYKAMREDPIRKEAEREWDLGDKMYRMWTPERDPDDWRADIVLPDGFSAIQSHMQETIDLRPRPHLEGVEQSDADLEHFNDKIFQFAMDKTDFDSESYKARNCSAIRGTAYTREEYRLETRKVKMPTGFKDGKFEYQEKEVVDYDDVYTRWVDNHSIFTDPNAEDPKYMQDYIYREVIPYDVFCALYKDKPGFKDTDKVVAAKNVPQNTGFFNKASDMTDDDVEILHYENKYSDSYDVLANNVIIREDALPNRHKELSLDVWAFYPIPGQIYGMGIPKIIYTLVEERRSIRNISVDRQKLHLAKMFVVNDLFDLDEDDLTPRLHGLIRVNTNGQPIQSAIMPLEYGDVPGSSLRMDEQLKEDERRAHGMDDRPAIQAGGTATEAAIIKESAQRRINLINTLSNWNTLIRLGRKKWSNIQFFYPTPKVEKILEGNKWKDKETYRTIKIDGEEYKVKGSEEKGQKLELQASKTNGFTRLKLDETYAGFMEGNFDVVVDAAANTVISKPIRQAQVMEMTQLIVSNPLLMQHADGEKMFKRVVHVTGESPVDWMKGEGMTEEDMKVLADQENAIFVNMAKNGTVYVLPPTPGATQAHTEVHLEFTNTAVFQALPQEIKEIIRAHIVGEHDANPLTPPAGADMNGGGGEEAPTGGDVVPSGAPGGPNIEAALSSPMVAGGDVTEGNPVA